MRSTPGILLLSLAAWAGGAQAASAGPIAYSFSGVVGMDGLPPGGTLDLGDGPVGLAGVAFTVTGTTINDIDLADYSSLIGVFAATATYDFGSYGSFTTDAGADYYFQVEHIGLGSNGYVNDLSLRYGTFTSFMVEVVSDPNTPTVGGYLTTISPYGGGAGLSNTLTNAGGQTLVLGTGTPWSLHIGARSVSVADAYAPSPNPVPEPSSLGLLGMGAAGLAARRRRRGR